MHIFYSYMQTYARLKEYADVYADICTIERICLIVDHNIVSFIPLLK